MSQINLIYSRLEEENFMVSYIDVKQLCGSAGKLGLSSLLASFGSFSSVLYQGIFLIT